MLSQQKHTETEVCQCLYGVLFHSPLQIHESVDMGNASPHPPLFPLWKRHTHVVTCNMSISMNHPQMDKKIGKRQDHLLPTWCCLLPPHRFCFRWTERMKHDGSALACSCDLFIFNRTYAEGGQISAISQIIWLLSRIRDDCVEPEGIIRMFRIWLSWALPVPPPLTLLLPLLHLLPASQSRMLPHPHAPTHHFVT